MNMESRIELQCVADVVFFYSTKQSQEHDKYPNVRREVIRFFHMVKPDDVCRNLSLGLVAKVRACKGAGQE